MRPRTYHVPTLERLHIDDRVFDAESSWIPYPDRGPEIRTHFGKFADSQFGLHEIGADIASVLFDYKFQQTQAKDVFKGLEGRLDAIEQSLGTIDGEAILNPHIMELK